MRTVSRTLNIAIFPPAGIARKAIRVSKKLKRKGGLFVLDGVHYFSHITLYMAEFPMKNLPPIRERLRACAANTKPFHIRSLKYRQVYDGYCDVAYHKSKALAAFQKNIVDCVTSFCDAFQSTDFAFVPHLTFTKLRKIDHSAFSQIDASNFSFEVNTIGLFYVGRYGTCRRLIEIFTMDA